MAAGIFEVPELTLSETEAKELSDCVKDVGQYYVASFDPKKVAIFNLVTCLGGIYSLRVMAYRARMAAEREKRAPLAVMPKQAAPTSQPAPRPEDNLNPPVNPITLNPPADGGGEY